MTVLSVYIIGIFEEDFAIHPFDITDCDIDYFVFENVVLFCGFFKVAFVLFPIY